MKKTFFVICLVVFGFSSVSCTLNGDILYTDFAMCDVINPTMLKTDGAVIYNIVKNDFGEVIPTSAERVMVMCDVLNATEGKADQYDVSLTSFVLVSVVEPIVKSEADEQAVGHDGICLESGWYSGGKLNCLAKASVLDTFEEDLIVNLLYDDTRSNADTLYFELRYNGQDYSFDNESMPVSSMLLESDYYSFPIKRFMPAGKSQVILNISWDWFVSEENILKRAKERQSAFLLCLPDE